jgi:hypothetical protein
VAIGAHDNKIGGKNGSLREKKVPHLFTAGRQASYLHVHTVARQMTRDIRSRLLAVTRCVAIMIYDQDLNRLGLYK